MFQMRKLIILIFVFGLFAQQEVTIRIKGGIPAIRIAVPDFIKRVKTDEGRRAAMELEDTFRADLSFSRVFDPLSSSLLSLVKDRNPERPDLKAWESIGATVLFIGKIEERRGGLRFSGKLYDTRTGNFILGKSYIGKFKYSRLMAHKMGDELLKYFGQIPIFTSKIAFISDRDGNRELYIMDYDGANQMRLTFTKAMEMLPSWSTDGEKIAYTSYRRGTPDLFVRYIYEGRDKLIATGGSNITADFSQDDNLLLYSSSLPGNYEIYLYNFKTEQRRRITFSRASDLSPKWSPDERQILFSSDRSGYPQLYIMNRDGSDIRRITFQGSYNASPSWAPDGDRIVYVSRIEGRFNLYLLFLSTSEVIKLTSGLSMNENPCFSPDGRHIVFSSNRSGKYQIYIMDYDGRNLRQLTQRGNNQMPSWSKIKYRR